MSPFMPSEIWFLISRIPANKVATYGQLARMMGAPNYARVVGNILKQLPAGSDLPWHRVVNSKGLISFPSHSSRYQEQKTRLEREGIVFDDEKINLTCYRWNGEI